jgi:CubicO group peptidase (beta-lactamase class C family)
MSGGGFSRARLGRRHDIMARHVERGEAPGVVTRRDAGSDVPGRFGWDGGDGTSWASDPREGLVAILMTQRLGYPGFSNLYLDVWTSAYQAIDD